MNLRIVLKNRDRKIRAMGALIAFAGLISILTQGAGVPDAALVQVREGGFDVKVATVGRLDTANAFHVISQIRGDRGKIIQIAEDGARVEKGDILVAFDPTFFESEIHRLEGELASRRSVLEYQNQMLKLAKSETDKQISNQKLEVETTRQEHRRFQAYIGELGRLKEQGFSIDSEIAQAGRKAEAALTQTRKAEADLDRLRKEAIFKIAQAVAEVTKAQGEIETTQTSLASARAELAKATVRAPNSGFVVLEEIAAPGDPKQHKIRVGDTVWQGQPLLYLPDSSAMLVKTQVREVDLHNLKPGLDASVEVDAYPGARLTGKVEQIGVLALENSGAPDKNFQFTVRLQDQDARLRPGMTARVSILVDRVKDAQVIPLTALFGESGAQHAYVLDGRKLVERKVTVGRWNEDVAEVIAGLKAGEKVSLVKP